MVCAPPCSHKWTEFSQRQTASTVYRQRITELVAAKGYLGKLIVFLDFGFFVHMRLLLNLGGQSG